MPTTITQQNPACPECGCKRTTRKGKRRNRLQTLQVFQCTECLHRFTGEAGKNRTYPLKLILESISTFNLGYSLTETQRVLRKRFHRDIPERTISSWLTEHRALATYSRLRLACRKLFRPAAVIYTRTFHHQQVYRFQVHRAKLELLAKATPQPATHPGSEFSPLKTYLESIKTRFQHDLFQATGHRSSKFPAEIRPPVTRKENHATRLAGLGCPRHPTTRSVTRPCNGSCSSTIP